MTASTLASPGLFARWRSRFFGEADPVERQLADIAKQGAGMARIAHLCASALLILFSAASFVALGSDTFAAIQAQWRADHTLNIPSAISLSVITLMVLAFDVGMIYAASMLRLLATRRAGFGEQWVHAAVMVGVASIEASTYTYMAWRFERPADGIAWALIIMRAVAAPLLAVYLSMARALPVTARDILAQVELASGAGVLRDVIVLASDTGAPLLDKLSLYDASAVMTGPDRTRLNAMLAVAQRRIIPPAAALALEPPSVHAYDGADGVESDQGHDSPPEQPEPLQRPSRARRVTDTRPPTGGGSPAAARGGAIQLVTPPEWRNTGRVVGSGRYNPKRVRTASAEAKARRAWDNGARTVGEIVLKSASDPSGRIGRSAASKYRRQFLAEEANATPQQAVL